MTNALLAIRSLIARRRRPYWVVRRAAKPAVTRDEITRLFAKELGYPN